MDLHYSNKRKTTLASFKEKVQNKMLYTNLSLICICAGYLSYFLEI